MATKQLRDESTGKFISVEGRRTEPMFVRIKAEWLAFLKAKAARDGVRLAVLLERIFTDQFGDPEAALAALSPLSNPSSNVAKPDGMRFRF